MPVDEYTQEQRDRIAEAVTAARVERQWGKEEAARHAAISSITWKRVEDGQKVQSTKLRAVEIALGWAYGSLDRISRGRPVAALDPDPIEVIRERGYYAHEDATFWNGFRQATQWANDCRARGAPEQLCSDFIGDAVALLNAVSIGQKYPETQLPRIGLSGPDETLAPAANEGDVEEPGEFNT